MNRVPDEVDFFDGRERNTEEVKRLVKRRPDLLKQRDILNDRLRVVETYLHLAKQGLV